MRIHVLAISLFTAGPSLGSRPPPHARAQILKNAAFAAFFNSQLFVRVRAGEAWNRG